MKGYGILAPDLLGYGGTDKPKELEAFRYKMADEVVGILDHERVEKVLGVAHDWCGLHCVSHIQVFGDD